MKKFINDNLFTVSLTFSILIILIIAICINTLSNNGNVYINTISGDKQVLNGFDIEGFMYDNNTYGGDFQISDGNVKTSFGFIDSNKADNIILGKKFDDYSFEKNLVPPQGSKMKVDKISNSDGSISINKVVDSADVYINAQSYTDEYNGMYVSWGDFRIKTGLKLMSDNKFIVFKDKKERYDEESDYYSSEKTVYFDGLDISNEMIESHNYTIINDNVYFTTVANEDFVGTNGIYRIDKFVDSQSSNEYDEYGEGKQICEFNMSEEGNEISVLGLTSINNNLMIIMVINNVLTLRLYDIEGNMISEIMADDKYYFDGKSKFDSYNSGGYICFNFYRYEIDINSKSGSGEYFACVNSDNELYINTIFEMDKSIVYDMGVKDNKLIIITAENVTKEEYRYKEGFGVPTNIFIKGYDINEKNAVEIYNGELVWDAEQDWIKLINKDGGLKYYDVMLRYFYNIKIK